MDNPGAGVGRHEIRPPVARRPSPSVDLLCYSPNSSRTPGVRGAVRTCRVLFHRMASWPAVTPAIGVLVQALERRQVAEPDELLARQRGHDGERLSDLGQNRLHQRGSENQLAIPAFHLDDRIFQIGFDGGELIAGQRPRGGGPNEQVGVRQVLPDAKPQAACRPTSIRGKRT